MTILLGYDDTVERSLISQFNDWCSYTIKCCIGWKNFYFVEVLLSLSREKDEVCFMAFDKNLNILHFHKTSLYDIKYLFLMSSHIHFYCHRGGFIVNTGKLVTGRKLFNLFSWTEFVQILCNWLYGIIVTTSSK